MCARLYAAYDDGLRVVDTETGDVSVRLADRAVECLSVVPGDERSDAIHSAAADARLLVGTFDAGLFRSVDGGETFERVAAETLGPGGSGPDAVTAVATSPHDPSVVWMGTEPSRVYRSTDGGETVDPVEGLTDAPSASEWSFPPRPDTHHVRWIEPCPADPERWFVGVEAGALLVTPDDGETWVDRPDGSRRDNHALATHPDAPDRVYAAAGDGFAESRDRGESWRVVDAGLDHGYVWGIAVDPGDPETVLVSAASGAMAAHRRGEAYLYRRTTGRNDGNREDGGQSPAPRFERLDDRGIPTGEGTYRAVLTSGRAAGEVWALHNAGLYRTDDAGGSFERVPADLPDHAARALAVAGD
ncbi:WD40/YVTN/BNR-like repeat-containing protein [Halorubrum sp. HHNYT27]|uniref:WD40/YVTN/BNR-like repeat-containing protein n=1 Tax=Halorubrum sp. HHNYT27 TaxID=3402275 RepID=UPI003EBE13DC